MYRKAQPLEDQQAEGTQAEPTPSPQAGNLTEGTQAEPEVETISLDEAKKLRAENANLRKRAKELEQFEKSHLSEQERKEREFEATIVERDTLRETLRAMRAEAATRDAGAIYPDLVAARIPAEALDDPKATAAAIKDLKATYPNMFRSPNGSADGGAGQTGQPQSIDINEAFRALARNAT